MQKRLFVGIPISSDLEQQIVEWEKNVSSLPVRWLRSSDLHITLIPPWEEREELEVVSMMEQIRGAVQPCALRFTAVEFGPTPRNPRLLWATGTATPEIYAMKELVEEALDKPSHRSLKPHITLGRCTKPLQPGYDYSAFHQDVEWEMTAQKIALYESHITHTGSTYSKLVEC